MPGTRYGKRPILILGGTGQVGFELRRELAGLSPIVAPSREGVDLTDSTSIRDFVRRTSPYVIVNAAAYTAVDRAEAEPEVAEQINARAPEVLAREARNIGAAFIHYSTDYVFDGRKAGPYAETDSANPLGVYGRTKLAGEQGALSADGASIVLRCSWVYSRRGSNFFRTMLRVGTEQPVVSVVDDQLGAPTWAREIARATAAIFESLGSSKNSFYDAARAKGGIYHLTAGGQTTWCGFARAIFERTPSITATVKPISSVEYPTPAARPANSVLDNNKISQAFGIRMPAWQDQLDQSISTDL